MSFCGRPAKYNINMNIPVHMHAITSIEGSAAREREVIACFVPALALRNIVSARAGGNQSVGAKSIARE